MSKKTICCTKSPLFWKMYALLEGVARGGLCPIRLADESLVVKAYVDGLIRVSTPECDFCVTKDGFAFMSHADFSEVLEYRKELQKELHKTASLAAHEKATKGGAA